MWSLLRHFFLSFMVHDSSIFKSKISQLGRQLQLCSLKNKTQLSHTVCNSLQQLFLSFCFSTECLYCYITSPCAVECTSLYAEVCTFECGGYDGFDSLFLLKPAFSDPQMNVTTAQMERYRLTDIFPVFGFKNCKVPSELLSPYDSSQVRPMPSLRLRNHWMHHFDDV